jgi:hypothetical protein
MIIKNMDRIYRFAMGFILFLALLFVVSDNLDMIVKYSMNYLVFISSVLGATVLLYSVTLLIMKILGR